tara:strand:- start:2555 stop:3103 length:549 start_codon:yes stop_codon:yes gene_type:complete
MSNRKLIFKHEIPVEVFSQSDISLEILINDQQVFKKKYCQDQTHRELIAFNHEYQESTPNKLTFMLSGDKEVEKRHLKIFQICLNRQIVDKYAGEYFPILNPEWWQTLSEDEQQRHKTIIYGKHGAQFGWYGEINYYYYAGFDFSSQWRYNKSMQDPTKLLNERRSWVYLDEDAVRTHHKLK